MTQHENTETHKAKKFLLLLLVVLFIIIIHDYLTVILCANSNTSGLCLIQLTRLLLLLHNKVLPFKHHVRMCD